MNIESLANDFERFVNKEIDDYEKKSLRKLTKEMSKASVELNKEARKMYNWMIQKYYFYYTKVYIRHGQDDNGTRTGINLYKGYHSEFESSNFEDYEYTSLGFIWDGGDMEDYSSNYKTKYKSGKKKGQIKDKNFVSAEYVLTQTVMKGIRGLDMEWDFGTYSSKYFSFSGTMEEAFDEIELSYDDIILKIIGDSVSKYSKKINKEKADNINRYIENMCDELRQIIFG